MRLLNYWCVDLAQAASALASALAVLCLLRGTISAHGIWWIKPPIVSTKRRRPNVPAVLDAAGKEGSTMTLFSSTTIESLIYCVGQQLVLSFSMRRWWGVEDAPRSREMTFEKTNNPIERLMGFSANTLSPGLLFLRILPWRSAAKLIDCVSYYYYFYYYYCTIIASSILFIDKLVDNFVFFKGNVLLMLSRDSHCCSYRLL